ncbi:hypothetical protein CONLIGDRAFT_720017 [Coniochaeta ligniaria NRRL 30616]|uniref:Uncharacterized protein n=1 Tax=Coniochaeta ligniaria NRRL 30616 TaxID=1408157 RepID=A0A1J7I3Y6_9PEZI|nr:hypothetical protein CONLIGDRAFT_720017 [Coniochaeta ligniaria NRRL 30616]
MRRNPGISHTLPARTKEELKKSEEYTTLEEKIEKLCLELEPTHTEEGISKLKPRRMNLYAQRLHLEKKVLDEYQGHQKLVYELPENCHGSDICPAEGVGKTQNQSLEF